jgi:hypothetical protein
MYVTHPDFVPSIYAQQMIAMSVLEYWLLMISYILRHKTGRGRRRGISDIKFDQNQFNNY